MDELNIFGRLFAILDVVLDNEQRIISDYFKSPSLSFPYAFLNAYKKLIGKHELTLRISRLICMLDGYEESCVNISPEDQEVVKAAFLFEKIRLAKSIGEQIWFGREKLGISQAQLAEKAGIEGGRNTVCRYEKNINTPSAMAIEKIRNILGIEYI